MKLLYLDAAGDPGLANTKTQTKYYILACLCIDSDKWFIAYNGIRNILNKYFKPLNHLPKELKYSDIHHNKFPYNKLPKAHKTKLVDDIFDLVIHDLDSVLFAMVVDKNKHVNKYTNPEKPNILALRYIIPRFSKYLGRVQDHGMIIYDAEERTINKELRDFTITSREHGVVLEPANLPFYIQNKLEHIIGTIVFEESHTSPLIQLADFIARTVFLRYERNDQTRFKQIEHKFDNYNGMTYGLKVIP